MQFTLLASLSALVGFVAAQDGTPIAGQATVFSHAGQVGACGTPIQDTDLAVALSSSQFNASWCGETMTITLTGTTTAVDVVIVDICSACVSPRDIGLTEAAFEALAPLSEGFIDVTYPRFPGPIFR
ncbi:hypothetical protein C8F01DRAFT_1089622 [Mycena amicta]|nr:hypothetical protein C8F01DRAFT_1089622 [Mycena amicta]